MTAPVANSVSARLRVIRDGGALVVTATIDNDTPAPIWVLDPPLVGDAPSDKAIISRGDPGFARVVLGFLNADSQRPKVEQGVARQVSPIATQVAARGSRTRTIRLPMPLTPWHPYLQMATLSAPTQLVLEVGYLTSEPVWTNREIAGGLRIPDALDVDKHQLWARSTPVAIP